MFSPYYGDATIRRLADGYWYHPPSEKVFLVNNDSAETRDRLYLVHDPSGASAIPARLSARESARLIEEFRTEALFYGGGEADRAKAIAQANQDYQFRASQRETAPPPPPQSKPAAPKSPAAPTYVPVPTSPSTALVPMPGKTGGASTGLTQKPWFWPAVAGGGLLVLLGLYAALRGKKGSKKAPAPAAPAVPASRFKF